MKKVIFADDDPTIQDVMHLILDDDYEVISLLGGEKLVEGDFEIPDLFLLDRQLTAIDGLQLCRHFKGARSDPGYSCYNDLSSAKHHEAGQGRRRRWCD